MSDGLADLRRHNRRSDPAVVRPSCAPAANTPSDHRDRGGQDAEQRGPRRSPWPSPAARASGGRAASSRSSLDADDPGGGGEREQQPDALGPARRAAWGAPPAPAGVEAAGEPAGERAASRSALRRIPSR